MDPADFYIVNSVCVLAVIGRPAQQGVLYQLGRGRQLGSGQLTLNATCRIMPALNQVGGVENYIDKFPCGNDSLMLCQKAKGRLGAKVH